VLVPRGGKWGDDVAATLRESGAIPVIAPLINFASADDAPALAEALDRLQAGAFDWVVVTSATTVDVLAGQEVRIPPGTRIAAVGETTAAALAGITQHIRIGVAVTPVFTRTPAVLAATANTLGQLLPGRFVLGLGTSSQTMMIDWHGVAFDKPLTRVRNTALLVRSMLRGEKSDFDRDGLRSRNYRQEALENPPPIYLAALRPKMIETAAEVGDGVIINLWPRSALPNILEHVRIGAERAGKDWRTVEIVNRAMVLVTDDRPAARNLFRAAFAPYYANPVYNHFLAWAGFAGAAGEIAATMPNWAKMKLARAAMAAAWSGCTQGSSAKSREMARTARPTSRPRIIEARV